MQTIGQIAAVVAVCPTPIEEYVLRGEAGGKSPES
jgi:hypothetical protein